MKKRIVEALERIKYQDNHKDKYKKILDYVRSRDIDVTKNRRGYWFNLTSLSEKPTQELYNMVIDTSQQEDGGSAKTDL